MKVSVIVRVSLSSRIATSCMGGLRRVCCNGFDSECGRVVALLTFIFTISSSVSSKI